MVYRKITYLGDAVPDVSSDYGLSTGEYVTHDLFVSYLFTGSISANLGVNNLLVEEASIILGGIPGNTTGTDADASVYNSIGRSASVGVRMQF